MKPILKIIFLSLPVLSMSQQTICVYNDYEVFGNDTINMLTNNSKDGLWIDYEVGYESYDCFTSKRCYHQKGIRFIKSKGEYSNGKKSGKWNYFYTTGQLKSKGEYSNGKKIGEWNYFYDTGELMKKDSFSNNGKRVGNQIEFFKNGTLKSNQNWESNELKSQVVFFENGKTKYQSEFKRDNIIESFKIYYETGEVKYQGKEVVDWEIKKLICFQKDGKVKKIRPLKFGSLLSNEDLIEYL